MDYPHTGEPLEAFLIAETALAAAFTAFVSVRPLPSRVASLLFTAAAWLLVAVPMVTATASFASWPRVSSAFESLPGLVLFFAFVFAMRAGGPIFSLLVTGAVAAFGLKLSGADPPQAAALLAGIGLSYGLLLRSADADRTGAVAPQSYWNGRAFRRDDALIFVVACVAAALVAVFVLDRFSGTGDEWAYSYQADLFAHLKAYGAARPCDPALKNFWVFDYDGRSFAQYTPGWPLVMAPFQAVHLLWLAGPFTFGALGAGIARLARRLVATGLAPEAATLSQVRLSGGLAAALACLGPGLLLQGGSRMAHTLSCACVVWSVEWAFELVMQEVTARRRLLSASALGGILAFSLATRPVEGALAGLPVGLFLLWGMGRRRFGAKDLLLAFAGFATVAVPCAVILRLQTGTWGATGYSLTPLYQPLFATTWRLPEAASYRHIWPLFSGAYMWWPAAPTLGLIGLLLARGESRRLAVTLSGVVLLLALAYPFLSNSQNPATGHGPRFHVLWEAIFAVGTAALIAPTLGSSRAKERRFGAACGGAALLGTALVARLVYPPAHAQIHRDDAPFRAIEAAGIHHAVVTVKPGEVGMMTWDLTQNFPPLEDNDVLVVNEQVPGTLTCIKERFPGRKWYRAVGIGEVTLLPRPEGG